MVKNVSDKMKIVLTSGERSNMLKASIIKCYVYSTLLYGTEIWAMNRQLESIIEDLKMWIQRRSCFMETKTMKYEGWERKKN